MSFLTFESDETSSSSLLSKLNDIVPNNSYDPIHHILNDCQSSSWEFNQPMFIPLDQLYQYEPLSISTSSISISQSSDAFVVRNDIEMKYHFINKLNDLSMLHDERFNQYFNILNCYFYHIDQYLEQSWLTRWLKCIWEDQKTLKSEKIEYIKTNRF